MVARVAVDFSVTACDRVEKLCPDASCKAQRDLNGRTFKCVCNTDLCNSNITWSPDAPEELQRTSSYSEGATSRLGSDYTFVLFNHGSNDAFAKIQNKNQCH